MSPKAIVLVLALGLVGTVAVVQSQGSKSSKKVSQKFGPPPNAEYLDVSPSGVIAAGSAANSPGTAGAIDDIIGKWVPETGLQGVVESVNTYNGREALRLTEYDSKVIGGSYTIIAVVGEDHGKDKGNIVHVQGQVAEVTVKRSSFGVFNQIVLEDAIIVK